MDIHQIHQILIEAGANVIPRDIADYRPEIVNVLLAQPDVITGRTVPEMVAAAWPGQPTMHVAARLSRPPWDAMADAIREWLLAEGWYFKDTAEGGRRWFPPEFDSSGWSETH